MSHPRDRRDRFLIGKRKGAIRARGYTALATLGLSEKDREQMYERLCYLRRSTTKLCSCEMCGNPRRYHNEKTFQELKISSQ